MADDTTTTMGVTQQDVENVTDIINAAKAGTGPIGDFTTITTASGTALHMLTGYAEKAGVSLKNMGTIGSQQTAAFGLLTTALIGTQKQFDHIANVDTTKLTTFTGQVEKLGEILTKPGTAASVVSKGMGIMADMMLKAGESSNKVNAAIKEGPAFMAAYAKNVLESADNITRLSNAMIQLSGGAGNIEQLFHGVDGVFKGVGDDLQNLNGITMKYNSILDDTARATGIYDKNILANYAATINALPGGLKELMSATELGSKSTNILTGIMQYATGTGREQKDVMQDVSKAVLEYGTSFKDAMSYTANVGEIAKNFNMRIEDVQSTLTSSLDAFKFFALGEENAGKITQGLSHSVNDMIGSLIAIGVPAKNAGEIVSTYMGAIKDLTQAQEAFISKQSGGPGGLMGGFQIEKMIRSGDIEGVKKKVEDTIKRMTGPLVSLDEASKSQAAASKYTRQLQIIQNGPLGGLAKTRDQAEDLLESFRKGGQPGGKTAPMRDSSKILAEGIGRGAKLEQTGMTKLTEAIVDLTEVMSVAGAANKTTLERGLSARAGQAGGSDSEGRGISAANQDSLRKMQERGMHPSGQSPQEKMMDNFGELINSLPASLKESAKTIGEGLTSKNKETQQEAQRRLMDMAKSSEITKMPQAQKEAAEKSIQHFQTAVKGVMSGSTNDSLYKHQPWTPLDESDTMQGAAGRGVKANANIQGKDHRGVPAGQHPLGATGSPIPVVLAAGSGITVNFTGTCPHCGKGVHTSEQAAINSAPSQASNKSGY